MARSLVVWGFDMQDWTQEQHFMLEHGCTDPTNIEVEGSAAWCTVCFPSLTEAAACGGSLHERFGHLRVCVEPDWQALGSSEDTVADLIDLAEWLGCRDKSQLLPHHEAVCVARGAARVLDAVELVGGVQALKLADLGAATCLGLSLMQAVGDVRRRWLPSNLRSRVERAFAAVGPEALAAAAAELHDGALVSPQRACAACRLTNAFLATCSAIEGFDDVDRVQLEPMYQSLASACAVLLCATAQSFTNWTAAVEVSEKQQQQQRLLANSTPQPATPRSELDEASVWLPAAAGSLLSCMQQHQLCSRVEKWQLVLTLRVLVIEVVACIRMAELGAEDGLWPVESASQTATACVGQLHTTIKTVLTDMDQAARAAAGVVALHDATMAALGIALNHPKAPRHAGLLCHLLVLTKLTAPGATCWKHISLRMTRLACIQRLATTWLSETPQQPPPARLSESPLTAVELLSPGTQLALLMDINACHMAAAVTCMLNRGVADAGPLHTHIVDTKAIDALAAALQVEPSKNVRDLSGGLVKEDTSSCLAPGLFDVMGSLLDVTQSVSAVAGAAPRLWMGDAIAALVCGAHGSFRLAHVEAAAQEALPHAAPRSNGALPDPCKPHRARLLAARIMQGASRCITPLVARTLIRREWLGPVLQALPWQATSAEVLVDNTSWQTTVMGTRAVCEILAAALAADATLCDALLRDGSWHAALQRVRDLQPPPALAPLWHEQRESLLHGLTAVLAGKSTGSRGTSHGGGAVAEDGAIAAAERAMQELLAAEQPAQVSGQRSKAAVKRARKKAEKQQPARTATDDQHAGSTAEPVATSVCVKQAATLSRSSTPAAGAPQTEADPVVQAPPCSRSDSTGVGNLPQQHMPAAADHLAAKAAWWRCSLRGEVMHDPVVLLGSEGHSFEREALEEWLAVNPGVHPLSRQPLLPGEGNAIPNHAVRKMLQQLHLS